METQAQAPGQPQASEPVHPIHQEQQDLNNLESWIKNNRDNDPHEGTDLEEQREPEAPTETPAETEPEQPEQAGQKAEQPSVEIDEDAAVFEIEYKTDSGKQTKKLSLKDLRKGYLATEDYHRNIQKVKEQERTLQKKVEESRLAAQQEYVQRLEVHKQAVLKTVAPELQGVDLNKLAMEDPAEAQRLFFRQIQVNQALQGIEQEQRQAAEQLKAQQQSQFQQAARQAWETLTEEIPGWNEEKYQSVLKSAQQDYGFDARQVVDASLLKALHDAVSFRQLQTAKPEINKRVVSVPKVIKPGSADKPAQTDAVSEALKRFKKTGRDEDFIALELAKKKNNRR